MPRWFPFWSVRRLAAIERRLAALNAANLRLEAALSEHRGEMRAVLSSLTLPNPGLWQGRPPLVQGTPGESVFESATVCRQDSFEQPYFSYWSARLNEGLRYHRKLWEFVFICQALWERGAVRPGARGLGFGVGQEPLPAYFASEGCLVTATDMDTDGAREAGWIATHEHAADKAALRRPTVCPDEIFDANVAFRTCDMNAVPEDLVGYDFCWSACALEHLGSIQHGLDFISRSIDCLKPGGWAVHTTELTLSSDQETVDHRDTVLFRRSDLRGLAERLTAQGHRVAPFDFDPGLEPLDRYIDVPPYRVEPHLKLALWGHAITSVGMIVQRGHDT